MDKYFFIVYDLKGLMDLYKVIECRNINKIIIIIDIKMLGKF